MVELYTTRRFLWYWPKGLKFRRKKLRKQIGWPSFKHKLNKGTPFLSKKNKIKLKRKNGQKFFLCWKTHLSCGCRFQGNFPPFEHWREKKVRCALPERPSGAVFPLFPFFWREGIFKPRNSPTKKKRWRCSGRFTSSLLTLYLNIALKTERDQRDAVATKFNSSLFSVCIDTRGLLFQLL